MVFDYSVFGSGLIMDAARFGLDQTDGSPRGGKPHGVSFTSENTFIGGGGKKTSTVAQITTIHTKARLPNYPGNSIVRRFKVPDEKVLWEVRFFVGFLTYFSILSDFLFLNSTFYT